MQFLEQTIAPLGMGCWPIGGPMFNGPQSLGYTRADDATSLRTIHAARANGIALFDTAAAYGAGHAERLLGQALRHDPNALIVTKIGIGIDEATRQITFDPFSPDMVLPAIEACLRRLARDRIDLLLLHVNEMPIGEAEAVFDMMETARAQGKISAYGWSTDHSDRAKAMAPRDGFVAVEHAMNVFFNAPRMQKTLHDADLLALIRSPLAMGLLSGKYDASAQMPSDDVRASREVWMEYFQNGRANPAFLKTLDSVRELLMTGGRSLVQGALGWIWAQGPSNVPIPGARTVEQIEGLTTALSFGPLPANVVREIESLVPRDPDAPDRPR